jgi:pimeloyl-ACP methyl ester carboxylesterase
LESRSAQSLDNVHVIFVESPADIGHVGRIEDVCCEMQDMGVRNAVYFEPFVDGGSCELAQYVLSIRAQNPQARIMLVGWSIGTVFVKNALTELDAHGESVDTIVYIDSTTIILSDLNGHPENYDRAVLIYRRGRLMPSLPNSVSRCVDELFHLPVAHNERTIDQLVLEATRLADGR